MKYNISFDIDNVLNVVNKTVMSVDYCFGPYAGRATWISWLVLFSTSSVERKKKKKRGSELCDHTCVCVFIVCFSPHMHNVGRYRCLPLSSGFYFIIRLSFVRSILVPSPCSVCASQTGPACFTTTVPPPGGSDSFGISSDVRCCLSYLSGRFFFFFIARGFLFKQRFTHNDIIIRRNTEFCCDQK